MLEMKKVLILILSLMFVASMIFMGIGCKAEEAVEEAIEEAVEEVEEAVEEAVEEVEEAVEEEAVEEEVEKTTLSFPVFADLDVPTLEAFVQRFTDDTGWPVNVEGITGTEYENVVNARLVSGTPPDILYMHGNPAEYQRYNPGENLMDLTEWIEDNLTGRVSDHMLDLMSSNGVLYGVPISPVTLRGWYYNMNVLADAGVDLPTSCLDFMENTAPALKAAGYIPLFTFGQDTWGPQHESQNFQADVAVETDIEAKINNNEATFEESGYLAAYEWLLEMKNRGLVNEDAVSGLYADGYVAVETGVAFMVFGSTNTLGQFSEEAREGWIGGIHLSENSNRAHAALPHIVGLPIGGNYEGGMAFLEWLVQAENLEWYYSTLGVPGAYVDVEATLLPAAAELNSYYVNGPAPFSSTLKAAVKDNYASAVLAGTMTPLEACQQMTKDFAENAKAAGLEAYQ
jgi:ABC-type glycerol-3-phosphate transport system substrate-binding protein